VAPRKEAVINRVSGGTSASWGDLHVEEFACLIVRDKTLSVYV
jgi:hypothetical protein